MAHRPPVDEQVAPLEGLGRFPRNPSSRVRRLADPNFAVALRGYDRASVDAYVEEVSRVVAELEARQSSEAVIKRALEDVGEQTSAILQKAHETAEEVTRRSRAQADDRVQEAEREVARLRRESDEWFRSIQGEVDALFADRSRVIEDMRALAEELLGVADGALERLRQDEEAVAAAAAPDAETTVEVDVVAVEPAAEETEAPAPTGDGPGSAEAPDHERDADRG